jgi:hypothetical protein
VIDRKLKLLHGDAEDDGIHGGAKNNFSQCRKHYTSERLPHFARPDRSGRSGDSGTEKAIHRQGYGETGTMFS